MTAQRGDQWFRIALLLVLVGSLAAAVPATLIALNELVFHGLALACSDGYAEATGEPPCRPDWVAASPALITLGIASTMVVISGTLLVLRSRGRVAGVGPR